MRPIRHVFSWLLATILVAALAHQLVQPFSAPSPGAVYFYDLPGENLVFSRLAAETGFSFLEPTGRVIYGVLLAIAGLCLVLPQTRRAGAISVMILASGMVIVQLLPVFAGSQTMPAVGAGLQNTPVADFYLTVATACLAGLLVFVHPGARVVFRYPNPARRY